MTNQPVPPRPDAWQPAPAAPVPTPTSPTPARSPRPLDLRPRATWRWWEGAAVYLGAFLVGGFAALPVLEAVGDDDLGAIVSTLVAALVILGLLVLWLRSAHPGWTSVLGFPRPAAPDVRAGVIFGIGLYPVMVFVVGLLFVVVFGLFSDEPVKVPEQVSRGLPAVGIVTTIVYGVAIAPIGEEVFFRGVLFRSIRDRHGFWPGALASAGAFGLIHYIPGPAFDSLLLISVMVVTGLGLAFIYERRGSMWAPIAAHVTFNVIGLALIYGLR